MFLTITIFLVGFYILVKGAEILIEGASSIAYKFGISTFIIGITIAGIGTSLPEFGIAFLANLAGEAGIAVSTVIGSNIFDLLFVLGAAAMLVPLVMRQEWIKSGLAWNMAVALLVGLFAYFGTLNWFGGLIMISIFAFWIYKLSEDAKVMNNDKETERPRVNKLSFSLGMVVVGMAGILLGSRWVVDGAVEFAQALGISQALIGLTIISIGTSIDELVISMVAAFRQKMGLAVGNIIGSTIFNFLMVFGLSAVVAPIIFPRELLFDFAFFAFSSALLYFLMRRGKEEHILSRLEGLSLIFLYFLYFIYAIIRG
ncbi:hypothetical protein A3A20_00590 [Candidatus Wolfebacteria bacterium RIFCSPLOWO2_01_FULL_45_19]|uniref:Sodium/calcium exchanger membrane region domain-containing protein n=1 Tax=Candidatus Wolfebacteria bacterium RIFCSPLOWO2_01_FULL_45_19 TaxID=1802557 RepID=A0A1F8DR27_9BACT|nr:MAG: CaCA family Na(+)/Ca(+) antiporter [Parcubacteria group bacterium GW2011_GWB1_45_9]OGM91077.1 MAG: hypothetical protein A3A20_00590 [Candidatus Wolfebacteria bacterium RIFCSPLOWO2_01_FULL_45_19]